MFERSRDYLSQVSRADAWRVQSQLGPWSMEVSQGQFVPFHAVAIEVLQS